MSAARPILVALGPASLAIALTSEHAAHAQSAREAAAQSLFDEAKVLFESQQYAAACSKFEASARIDAKGGTLLNLGLCREKQGKSASAWAAFSEARNLSAREQRPERVAFAEEHIAALSRRLARLRIAVPASARVEGLVVTLDAEPLPASTWGVPTPADAGAHRVEAWARGYRRFSREVVIEDGRDEDVTVPDFVAETGSSSGERGASSSGAPWILVGGGALALAGAGALGLFALDRRHEAERLCAAGDCRAGREANDEGMRAAWVANVAAGVGLVAIGIGVYFLVARHASARP